MKTLILILINFSFSIERDTILNGFPDVLRCGGSTEWGHLIHLVTSSSSGVVYQKIDSPNDFYVIFDLTTGAFLSRTGGEVTAGCQGQSISQLVLEKRNYNIFTSSVSDNTGVSSIDAGFPDLFICGSGSVIEYFYKIAGGYYMDHRYTGSWLTFDESKSYLSSNNAANMTPLCDNQSIAQLYSEERAINFQKTSSQSQKSGVNPSFPDLILCSLQNHALYLNRFGETYNEYYTNNKFHVIYIRYTLTGNFLSYEADVGSHILIKCLDKSITQLYAEGLALNFYECPTYKIRDSNNYGACTCTQTDCLQCLADGCTQCQAGTYLAATKLCVTTCPDPYFPVLTPSNICERCDFKCQACTSLADCVCADIRTGSPTCSCPDLYYSNGNAPTCAKCEPQCLQCSSGSGCTACLPSLTRTSNTPNCQCKDGFYQVVINPTQDCFACDSSCLKCNGPSISDCTACPLTGTTFQMGTTCVSTCSNGYYHSFTPLPAQCKSCDQTCLTCDGPAATNCKSCSSSRFLHNGSCDLECPVTGFFPDMITRECISCSTNCDICQRVDDCQQCSSSSFKINGLCTVSCPSTLYYPDNSKKICQPCHKSCQSCSDSLDISCESCFNGHYLTAYKQCMTYCSGAYFPNAVANQCDACPLGCTGCLSSTVCTGCAPGYYKYTNFDSPPKTICLSACARGSIKDQILQQCVQCREIDPNQIMVDGKCVLGSCPRYHFLDSLYFDCVPCSLECSSCTGPLSKDCTFCKNGYYQQASGSDKDCVLQCAEGFFPNRVDFQCTACGSNCQKCSSSYCNQCKSNYYRDRTGNCVSSCTSDYFENQATATCDLCHPNCLTCFQETLNDCQTCISGLFLFGGQCISFCPNGYYSNTLNNQCDKCEASCQTCNGLNDDNCVQCPSGTFNDNGQCGTACSKPRFFPNYEKGKCQPCHQDCQTCVGPNFNHCRSCRAGVKPLLLNQSQCVSDCPSGYFSNGSDCTQCHYTCMTCDGLLYNNCLQCNDQFYKVAATQACDTSCPNGFIENFNTNNCDAISTCPLKKFLNSQGICQNCHSECLTCINSAQTSCLSCDSPSFLNPITQTCVQTCPIGTFPDSQKRVCFKCSPKCKACSDENTCISCKDDLQRTIQNNCQCSDGYLTDDPDFGCPPCDYKCSKCQKIDINCLQCSANRLSLTPICPCPQGYFNVDGISECSSCDFKCLTCYSSGSNCIQCRGDRIGNDCSCPLGTYDDNTSIRCLACQFKCSSCELNSSNCKACRGNRILSQNCSCPEGSYQNGLENNCPKCQNKCVLCSNTADSCSTCKGDRINPPFCKCPQGQFDDGISQTCMPCDVTCQECDKYGCLQCYENRFGPVINQCICDSEKREIDRKELGTDVCTTCKIGVTDSHFSEDLSEIIISIGGNMKLVDETLNKSFTLCEKMLELIIIDKIGGLDSVCELRDGNFIIILGTDATIVTTDQLLFKQDSKILQLQGCFDLDGSLINIQTFTSTIPSFLPNHQLKLPLVTTNIIPSQISLCRETRIEILNFKNTGQRVPQSITWSLLSSKPPSQEIDQKLQQILLNASQMNSSKIIIPPLFLQSFTVYEIQITSINFAGIKGSTQIQLKTSSTESIEINVDNIVGASFYRKDQIKIVATIDHLKCASGQVQIVEDELDLNWLYVSGTIPLKNKFIDQIATKGIKEFSSVWVIPSYTFPSDSEQQLKIIVQSTANQLIQSEISWKIKILVSKLLTIIKGGNRNAGFSSDIQFQGKSTDLELTAEEQSIYVLDLLWTCTSVSSNEPCQNKNGQLIPVSKSETFIILKKQLEPYQAYIIQLEGAQNSFLPVKKSSARITLVVIQLDLPVLQVEIPEYLSLRQINLNEKLLFQLIYPNANPDELFYSGVFMYELEIVSLMVFEFIEFQFAIWDQFMDFQPSSAIINFRCSVYNPKFIMPSQSTVTLEVNLPPSLCQLEISNLVDTNQKDNHVSLEEKIRIQVTQCVDENKPLAYRFGFYPNMTNMNYDILKGLLGLNLNYLTEYQSNQYTDTFMIPSLIQKLNQAQILEPLVILAQIRDSFGGITNITKLVKISNPSISFVQNQDSIKESILKLQETKSTEVSQLTVYSISLSPFDSPDFLEIDNLLLSRLNYHLQFNPVSQWKEQITKALGVLNNKKDIIDSRSQNVTAFDSMFSNLNNFLNTLDVTDSLNQTEENIIVKTDNISATGTVDENSNKLLKSLDTVNSLLFSSNSKVWVNNNKLNNLTSNQGFTKQISNEKNQGLVNTILQIEKLLKQEVLPNQPAKEFFSESVNLKSQVLTSKQLNDLINPGDSFQLLENDDDNNDGEQSKSSGYSIYNFGLKSFQKNPYSAEDKFPYPESSNKVYLLNVDTDTEANYSKIRRTLEATSIAQQNSTTININGSSSTQQTNYLFQLSPNATGLKLNNNTLNDSNTCISKDNLSGNWTDEPCTKSLVKNSQGEVTGYSCQCGLGSPITLVDDFKEVLQNSKVQKAFSTEGINALSKWNFWEEPLFYTFAYITIMYLISLPFGIIKDSKDSQIHPQTETIAQRQEGDEKQTPSQRQLLTDDKNNPDEYNQQREIFSNDENQMKVEDITDLIKPNSKQASQIKIDLNTQNSDLKVLQLDDQEEQKKVQSNLDSKQKVKDFNFEDQISKKQINKNFDDNEDLKEEIFSTKNNDKIQNKNSQNEYAVISNLGQHISFSKKALWEIIKIEHTLVSIVFVYDQKQSRARRFSLEYIKLIVYLSILMGFAKSTLGQTIAVCVISSIVVKICISIVGSLLSSQKSIIQLLGALVTFSICGLGIWVIMILLAVSEQTDIEQGFYQYVSQILNDYIIIDNIKCLLSLIAIITKSREDSSQSVLLRIAYIFYQSKAHIMLFNQLWN